MGDAALERLWRRLGARRRSCSLMQVLDHLCPLICSASLVRAALQEANAQYRMCYTIAINDVNIYAFWFIYIIDGVIEVSR
jgi:hypothetical protein